MELTRPRVLALVLAGGEGGRLDVLTAERAKPALPFAGVYRLIDFPLSNCRHSGIADVWVLQQYHPHSLTEHLANGRPWDLDRTHGGLRVLQPHLGRDESGWYRGNADAIYRNKADIAAFGADLLLVLSADHVYKLDYASAVRRHVESGADVTVVTTEVAREEASRFAVLDVDPDGRLTAFDYKPDDPRTNLVATEVFVYTAETLLELLDELAGDADDEDGLADFGDELLPRLVEEGKAVEHRLESYWRDVGTVESYWQAHMDLLTADPSIELDDPSWPILTWSVQRPPALFLPGGAADESLVSPGCVVSGRVERSVLAPGVVVENDAVVRDSVVLENAEILAGSRIERAIVDAEASVGAAAEVGERDGETTLVGARARIDRGASVPAGARIEPAGSRAAAGSAS